MPPEDRSYLPAETTLRKALNDAQNALRVEPLASAATVHAASLSAITGASTITAGARSVSITNSGGAVGIVAGASLPAAGSVSWTAPAGGTLGAIAIDGTGTILLVAVVR